MKKLFRELWIVAAVWLALSAVGLQASAEGGIELPIIPGDTTHRYGAWTVETPATCTEDGLQYSICSICNKRKTQTIPALGHNAVTDIAVPATCTSTGLTEGSHCDRCGLGLVAQETTPITEHPFGDWTVTKDPTFTEEGQKEKTCSVCGKTAAEALPLLVGKVDKWNIVLKDALQVNLHILLGENIQEDAQVEITLGDAVTKHNAASLEKTQEGLFRVPVELAAAQMTQAITVRILWGTATSQPVSYSVRQYADTVLADNAQSQYHDLVRKMLHYGAAAQTYFAYEAEELANSGIQVSDGPQIPETAPKPVQILGSAEGVQLHSVSLVYRDRIALRYYFRLDGTGEDYTFTAGGSTFTPQEKDGLYCVEIPGITPEMLDQQVVLEVTDGAGNSLSAAYSPLNYIIRMNTKGSDSLKVLLKALYQYHLSAKALWLAE